MASEWEIKQMREHGWFAHKLIGDRQSPTRINYHTHGFQETLRHPDIQIVFPSLRPTQCHGIAATIFEQISEAKRKFNDGDQTTIPSKEGSFRVHFIKVTEDGRDVLRVILPNTQGKLEPIDVGSDEDPSYSLQWVVSDV